MKSLDQTKINGMVVWTKMKWKHKGNVMMTKDFFHVVRKSLLSNLLATIQTQNETLVSEKAN